MLGSAWENPLPLPLPWFHHNLLLEEWQPTDSQICSCYLAMVCRYAEISSYFVRLLV